MLHVHIGEDHMTSLVTSAASSSLHGWEYPMHGEEIYALSCVGSALTNAGMHCMSGKSMFTPFRLSRGLQIRNCVCVRAAAGFRELISKWAMTCTSIRHPLLRGQLRHLSIPQLVAASIPSSNRQTYREGFSLSLMLHCRTWGCCAHPDSCMSHRSRCIGGVGDQQGGSQERLGLQSC